MTYRPTRAIGLLALAAALALPAYTRAADAGTCSVNRQNWPLCGTDNGGWGVDNGSYCIARSFCSSIAPTASLSTPVDSSASSKTRAVFSYLRSVWGKQVLAGQADLVWRDPIDMAERVHADTGKYPALMGYDFMNYGLTANWVEGRRQTEEAVRRRRDGAVAALA